MRRLQLTVLLTILAPVATGSAQPPPALIFHDLSTMPRHPLGRMQARGAMGQTMSIMVTELPPGLKTTPHHHHQEQMMLGLDGGMHYAMAGTPYPLGRLTAAIALANIEHGNINDTEAPAVCVEFQPVLRPDWFPPHPRRPREGLPTPLSIPAGRKVTEDFSPSSAGWQPHPSGARSKSLSGETMRLTIWDLPASAQAVDLPLNAAVERMLYVLDGSAVIVGGLQRRIGREMLVIAAPSVRELRLTPSREGALVAIYEPIAR